MMLLKNGHVIDNKSGINGVFDVLIENGIVVKIEKTIDEKKAGKEAEIVDCSGKIVMPGLVDAHCHLRDPGQEYKEDIRTGTRSAAKGGFTSIACMPNTSPVIDNSVVVGYIKSKALEVGVVNVFPVGAISKGLEGKEIAEIGDMRSAGIVAVSDDGNPVKSSDLMKKAMQYASMFDVMVISHSEDKDLSQDGAMNEGYNSTIMGLKGIPTAAEDVMVARDVILAEYLNLPIHIAHVSTVGSVDIIRQAKKRGVNVTAETCPHYFSLTDDACLGFNTLAKVNPPLRALQDVEAVIEGLRDGTIDIIATDHAPHHNDEKRVEFDVAAKGMVGFETAFGLAVTKLVKTGVLTIVELVNKMCVNPAQMLGINKGSIEEGKDADIIVVDLGEDTKYIVDVEKFESKSKNSPFGGIELIGKVVHTIVGGRFVVKDERLV